LVLICLCFFLSGVAALIYQTAWTRQFALVFGTSELAVAAVLAAYMGGLALGAALVGRRLNRIRKPLRTYAWLELGIGAGALLVPMLLALAGRVVVALFGHQPTVPSTGFGGLVIWQLICAFLVLLVPTTFMGATLPMLTRYTVTSQAQIGQRVGLLYAWNTAGAVLGALGGALWILPAVGLARTVWIAVAINVCVAIVALLLSRHKKFQTVPDAAPVSAAAAHTSLTDTVPRFHWVLPLMLVSGAVSFLHEVLWMRMLSHVLSSSLYAFGVMVASFLAGIAAGGAVGAALAKQRDTAARWLAISELAVAATAIIAWRLLVSVPLNNSSLTTRVLYSLALLFPMACAIGVTYPLAVRVLATDVDSAGRSSARVYSWNTIGAILGSLAAGFFIVPALRYEGAVQLAVIASAMLAVVAVLLWRAGWRGLTASAVVAASLIVAVVFRPGPPESLLRYSTLRVNGAGEIFHYGVGRSAAVVTLRTGYEFLLRDNGLPEASIDLASSVPTRYVEAWMTPLAALARPAARELLVVGLGGGRVIEEVPASIRNIDVIELEPEVIRANQKMAPLRIRDPLADPRVNLIVNDARGALDLTDRRYDIIASQPSHPWTAGASHLYTRQFMQQVRQHLNPGGVMVQWMNTDFLDEPLLRSWLATIASVFPEVQLYRPASATLLVLASDHPLAAELDLAATGAAIAADQRTYGAVGINVPEDLLIARVADTAGVHAIVADATPITDDRNRFATQSLYDAGVYRNTSHMGRILMEQDPLLRPNDPGIAALRERGTIDYVVRHIGLAAGLQNGGPWRLEQLAERLGDSPERVYAQSLMADNAGDVQRASAVRRGGLTKFTGSALLRDAVLERDGRDSQILSRATDTARLVASAGEFVASEHWAAFDGLEARLAQIPWTSIWSRRAIQLRAIRHEAAALSATDTGAKQKSLADGLALINRACLSVPECEFWELRRSLNNRLQAFD
jgi:spermidine synthase